MNFIKKNSRELIKPLVFILVGVLVLLSMHEGDSFRVGAFLGGGSIVLGIMRIVRLFEDDDD